MAVNIKLTVRQRRDDGSAEAWAAAVADPKEALDGIAQVLADDIAERFATNTDPWGNPWPPPSPVTIALRGGDVEADGLPARIFHKVEGTKAIAGLQSAIARVRQFGAPNNRMYGGPSAPIPPRPMLPIRGSRKVDLPPEMHRKIMDTLRDAIRAAVREHRGASDSE